MTPDDPFDVEEYDRERDGRLPPPRFVVEHAELLLAVALTVVVMLGAMGR